MYKLPIKMYI